MDLSKGEGQRQAANLPDFYGLVEAVANDLDSLRNSAARQLLTKARSLSQDPIKGVGGLIAADRAFSMLEQHEFDRNLIQAAVARALKPKGPIDQDPLLHILQLATGPDGRVRLVTTNFDRLFEQADKRLPAHTAPILPDPRRDGLFEGIIYLHGRVNDAYTAAEREGFILASADYGRAYLADGWATSFIRALIEKYRIVFIGYSADDPPLHYLLEALHRSGSAAGRLYAFHAGEQADAEALWQSRGVQAIAYDPESHAMLWQTIAAWADRARDPEAWYQKMHSRAQRGPEAMQPHERGQVAHLAATVAGAKRLARAEPPLPARWLCVFDPLVRYAKPGPDLDQPGQPDFDPFAAFGLDSDQPPSRSEVNRSAAPQAPPADAFNAFALSERDQLSLPAESIAILAGTGRTAGQLPERLSCLMTWIARVMHEPAAVWWAAGQSRLHPDLLQKISKRLAFGSKTVHPVIATAWRWIHAAFADPEDPEEQYYQLLRDAERTEWSKPALRRWAEVRQPRIHVDRPPWRPGPPAGVPESMAGLVFPDIRWVQPDPEEEHIPEGLLGYAVERLRTTLEKLEDLAEELGIDAAIVRGRLIPETNNTNGFEFSSEPIALVEHYLQLLARLMQHDLAAARHEIGAWRINGGPVFGRLQIWAAHIPRLLTPKEAGERLLRLSDEIFWSDYAFGDLILALNQSWSDFPAGLQAKLERRILSGPPKWQNEPTAAYKERRDGYVFAMLSVLKDNDIALSKSAGDRHDELSHAYPDWSVSSVQAGADRRMEIRSVEMNLSFDELLGEPLETLLSKATVLGGDQPGRSVVRNPFLGLSNNRPVRALAALRLAGKRGEHPKEFWASFLNVWSGRQCDGRLPCYIADRLTQLPPEAIAELIRPVTHWVSTVAPVLSERSPVTFRRLWVHVLAVLRAGLGTEQSRAADMAAQGDWSGAAWNSPAGILSRSICDLLQQSNGSDMAADLVGLSWLDELLALPEQTRLQVLTSCARAINKLYRVSPQWTQEHLVTPALADTTEADAVWAGILWGRSVPEAALGQSLIAALRHRLQARLVDSRYMELVAEWLMREWGQENAARTIEDTDLREELITGPDQLRVQALNFLIQRVPNSTYWRERAEHFLRYVWPRQKAVRSPATMSKLCELAAADQRNFPLFVELSLELLDQIDDRRSLGPLMRRSGFRLAEKHPEDLLAMLIKVLPDNATRWPYKTSDVIDQLASQPSISANPDLAELKRRLAAV